MNYQTMLEHAMATRMNQQDNTKKMIEFNEGVSDWEASCPKCGTKLKGTLAQIREHVCGTTSNN